MRIIIREPTCMDFVIVHFMLIEGAYYVGDAPLHIRKDFQISESRFGFQKELFKYQNLP